jgi:hypothetical protein
MATVVVSRLVVSNLLANELGMPIDLERAVGVAAGSDDPGQEDHGRNPRTTAVRTSMEEHVRRRTNCGSTSSHVL